MKKLFSFGISLVYLSRFSYKIAISLAVERGPLLNSPVVFVDLVVDIDCLESAADNVHLVSLRIALAIRFLTTILE